jgi:hypothetical protein
MSNVKYTALRERDLRVEHGQSSTQADLENKEQQGGADEGVDAGRPCLAWL